MKLREYIDKYGINISAFARKIGVSRGTLTRILAGKPLTLEVALKIEKGTEGKVTCQELMNGK
jgi:plasmid maintenance system antidote protein VapI